MSTYDRIDDWSVEGRRALVTSRGDEIRLLLDEAFSRFADSQSLTPFGFLLSEECGDAITAAVEWSIERFTTGHIEPAQLQQGSRSMRLFTEVRFWLCQKVGRAAYGRILQQTSKRPDQNKDNEPFSGLPEDVLLPALQEQSLLTFQERLAATLRDLRHRTCADLVGFWLNATLRLRADWFGWRVEGEVSEEAALLRKKSKSLALHDAQFRFLCLYHRILAEPEPDQARAMAHSTFFRPCQNRFPYRRADALVLGDLPAMQFLGLHERRRLLRAGAATWLRTLLAWATRSTSAQDAMHRMAWVLTQQSLSVTTLHALDLDDDADLTDSLCLLRSLQLQAEDA